MKEIHNWMKNYFVKVLNFDINFGIFRKQIYVSLQFLGSDSIINFACFSVDRHMIVNESDNMNEIIIIYCLQFLKILSFSFEFTVKLSQLFVLT